MLQPIKITLKLSIADTKTIRLLKTIKKVGLKPTFFIVYILYLNYLEIVSKRTLKASGSLTAKSASIFLLTTTLAFLHAFTNLE